MASSGSNGSQGSFKHGKSSRNTLPPLSLQRSISGDKGKEGGGNRPPQSPLRRKQSDSSSVFGSDNSGVYQQLASDEAEDALITTLESRSHRGKAGPDGFRPAVPGERAPFGVADLGNAFGGPDSEHVVQAPNRRTSWKNLAQKLRKQASERQLEIQANTNATQSSRSTNSHGESHIRHRRAQTLLASIGEKEDDDANKGFGEGIFGLDQLDVFGADMSLDDIFVLSEDENEAPHPLQASQTWTQANSPRDDSGDETLPLLGMQPQTDVELVAQRRRLAQEQKMKVRMQKIMKYLNPLRVLRYILKKSKKSMLMVACPLWALAWVLFYCFGNPNLDFLPGEATLSWWCNFTGRHLLLLELSRVAQHVVIDKLVLRHRVVTMILGPHLTMTCIQSKGWPFVTTLWGILSMITLHGDNKFQQHWLWWTGIRIYSKANSGSYLLASGGYLRILISMVVAGAATTVKRTLTTFYFGQRIFETYKPKLEEILSDIILLSEVSELGAEADLLPDLDGLDAIDEKLIVEPPKPDKRARMSEVRWSSVRFDNTGKKKGWKDAAENEPTEENKEATGHRVEEGEEERNDPRPSIGLKTSSRSRFRVHNLLERWEEPDNKLDQMSESTVHDILKFRQALTYMDLEYPFSEAFGPASTRDEMITSAQTLYERLLKLAPGSKTLPSVVLAVLAEDDEGTVDREKRNHLRQLFWPNADDKVTMLSFIQSCDSVYKQLRYFRASVGNASVIDHVLEGIINTFFYAGLTLMILSLLNFNPWPFLASISALLVTSAFAIGPTAAKSIEGILLIVGRRPFDIGDRIIIDDSPGSDMIGVSKSWIVQDITLFSTTLRFGASNEVATISNGSIAASRITNCAQSKNAVVHLVMKLHITMHEHKNLELFREAIEQFILQNSNVWDSIVFLRCEDIDPDNEFVTYRLATRSRHTWKFANRILQDRANLHRFCMELATKLSIIYDSGVQRRILYYGGSLVDGVVKDYKKDLLKGKNVKSHGDLTTFLGSQTLADLEAVQAGMVPTVSHRRTESEGSLPDQRIGGRHESFRRRSRVNTEENDRFLTLLRQPVFESIEPHRQTPQD